MNIAVIDDLKMDRDIIKSYIEAYFSGHRLTITMYENGESFIKKFQKNSYNLIFLDYYLGGLSGLEVAKQIRTVDTSVQIIFTTQTSDIAVDGYKVRASGYLLKPISYHNFMAALDVIRAEQLHDEQYITLENGHENVDVLLKDIIYCDIDGHYSQIHKETDTLLRFRMPFQRLHKMFGLYPEFYLCYRGCIINLEKVSKIDELSIFMSNGDRIPFRKREYNKLRQLHQEFLFQKARRKV